VNWRAIFKVVLAPLVVILSVNLAFARAADFLSIATSIDPVVSSVATDPCDLLESIDIPDPTGDASAGSPSWVDTLGVQFRQLGSDTYIRWYADTTDLTDDDVLFANGQGFRLFFDTDHNSETGQPNQGIGAELKITLGDYHGRASLHYFDGPGNWIEERLIPIAFLGDGFALNLSEGSIPSSDFLLTFESIGTWVDFGGPANVILDSLSSDGKLLISSPNIVLESGPRLMNIPSPSTPLSLATSIFINDIETVIDPSQVSYSVTHPHHWMFTGDPKTIISIDTHGAAHYNSEGYVSATAAAGYCHLSSEKVLIATGDYYGDPETQSVIAVFPTDYMPDTSSYTFGDMMSGYPGMMNYLDTGYKLTSGMYGGFRPFDGDKQILAPLVVEGYCGAPGNPMPTTPCCYMNCGDATPQYNVMIHEMGHSFSNSKAMLQLLLSDQERFAKSGFKECVASLPVIYLEEEILHNGEAYDIYPESFEYTHSESNRERYCSEPFRGLPEFEQLISQGKVEGIFDNSGLFSGVQVFCSLFEAFSCDYVDGENLYEHQMIRRFLNVFDNSDLPEFVPEKVDTYFAAAYSTAAGRDMRTKLRFWGFSIDDEYYEQVVPLIEQKLSQISQMNAGLNDAWYNPDTDGQGFFITVFPDLNAVSLAWFTYDTDLPAEDATANLGDPGHRWLTAVGPIEGNQAVMEIEMTSGGLFDAATTIDRTDPPGSDGTITLTFTSCNSATVEYDIPSINKQGIVPIQRVANDNIVICEALSTD